MNKLFIVGNLTRDPVLRTANLQNGPASVCDFTVAVNRRQKSQNGQSDADFFRVTAWRGLADNCQKYLAKGRKVAVTGSVSVSTYQGSDGVVRASLDVTADDVEFLTPKQDGQQSTAPAYANTGTGQNAPAQPAYQQQNMNTSGGFVEVEDEELPF